jgi:hypothetical protein
MVGLDMRPEKGEEEGDLANSMVDLGLMWYEGVRKAFERCYSGVTRVLQGCYKGVTRARMTALERQHREGQ